MLAEILPFPPCRFSLMNTSLPSLATMAIAMNSGTFPHSLLYPNNIHFIGSHDADAIQITDLYIPRNLLDPRPTIPLPTVLKIPRPETPLHQLIASKSLSP